MLMNIKRSKMESKEMFLKIEIFMKLVQKIINKKYT